MCGRFTLQTPASNIASLFDNLSEPEVVPRYNIAPTQNVLAVRALNDEPQNWAQLRWGLIPFWAKDKSIGARMINARGETVREKPAFRAAFKKRRCLIVADGFYEWKKVGKTKQPYRMTMQDDQPFCFAGLWEKWQDKGVSDGDAIESCTIITTTANDFLSDVHDRMPVIMPKDQHEAWLDAAFDDKDALAKMLNPLAEGLLKKTAVSTFVNNARNESPQCLEPVET